MPSYHRETTRTLQAGNSYTGQTHDLIDDKYILVFAFADEDGEVVIEQSPDRTHWHKLEEESVQAGSPTRLVSEAVCQYARAYYENDTQRQNTFRLFSCIKEDR